MSLRKLRTTNGPAARAASVLVILAVLFEVMGHYSAYVPVRAFSDLRSYPVGTSLLSLVMLAVLVYLQQDVYWWRLSKSKASELDERQRAVRSRVIERSFQLTIVLLVIWMAFMWFVDIEVMRFSVSGSATVVPHTGPLFSVIVLIIALPSIVAAWQKDA